MSLLCLNIDMDVIASLVLVHILAPGDRSTGLLEPMIDFFDGSDFFRFDPASGD